ncbi:WD_REPEATS_REGION domain-containing protein, partial [Haematococcus lacustris]
MPHLKQLDRSATLAFCPEKLPGNVLTLIAAGTVAGAVDMTFSTNSVLEICSLDFANGSEQPSVVGSVQAPDRFNRLAWGQRLSSDASFPSMGLLAGGLADGSVCLWDPALIASKSDGRQPLLAKMQKHTGAFNTFSPNLLASGAADSDLCIWDLAKPATPSLYPALKGSSANGPGLASNEITFIAWNRKVQHILASSSTNGTTVVWDLKRQKPVISFRDPNSQRRASVLQWNPEVATQLVVASDDDRSPTLQMWDLRNSVSPLKEFVGHTKGVLGMAWSPHDSSLLLSSAKDNRNICWDVHSTDILCELPPSNNWNFDVQWCPTIPGVFSTSSFDGHVAVHSLHACTLPKITERVNADLSVTHQASGETVPLKKAPVWMKRPCGATFGFGGRLVTFANHRVTAMDASGQQVQRDQGIVTLSQVVTERELVARSEAFEAAIAGGDKTTLLSYCEVKAKAGKAADVSSMQPGGSGSQEDGETWAFLSLLFEAAGAHAGANGSAAGVAAGMGALNLAGSSTTSPTRLHGASGTDGGSATSFFAGQDDDPDFFDKLPDEGLMPNGASAPATPLRRSAGGADMALAGTKPAAAGELPQAATGAVVYKAQCQGRHGVGQLYRSGMMRQVLGAGGQRWPGLVAFHWVLCTGESERGSGAGTLMPQLSSLPDVSMEMEDEIQRALIAGNYETAVESCFKANRLADALLIANIFNSSDLYKRTMHRYMKRCPKPFMQIVRANVEGDFEALVRSRPVGQWRETLALLATYTQQDSSPQPPPPVAVAVPQEDWTRLCDLLASRLSLAGQHHAASLCYICAGNVEAVVAYWARSLAGAAGGAAGLHREGGGHGPGDWQQEGQRGAGRPGDPLRIHTGSTGEAQQLLHAEPTRTCDSGFPHLASGLDPSSGPPLLPWLDHPSGCMATALDYLDYVPGEASTAVAVLKDRIYRSGTAASTGVVAQGNAGSYRGHPPPFPFIQEEVRPAAAPAAQQPAKVRGVARVRCMLKGLKQPAGQLVQQRQLRDRSWTDHGDGIGSNPEAETWFMVAMVEMGWAGNTKERSDNDHTMASAVKLQADCCSPAASAFGGYASGYGHASSHQPQPAQPAYHAAATGTQYGQH